MAKPELQYAEAADGTPLAFRSYGEGTPVVLANGVTTSEFSWYRVIPTWQRSWRVIVWDYKGHGESGSARDLDQTTIPAMVDDMGRVMDAAGVTEPAALLGYSLGSQVVLEASRLMPERIRAVASILGTSGRVFDTAFPPFTGRALKRVLQSLGPRTTPVVLGSVAQALRISLVERLSRRMGFIGRDTHVEDMALYNRHFGRMDFPTVRRIALGGGKHDASDMLGRMPAPYLIIAGDRDPMAPANLVGTVMHAKAPGSRLHRMPHGSHTSLFEHSHEIGSVVEEFLRDVERDP